VVSSSNALQPDSVVVCAGKNKKRKRKDPLKDIEAAAAEVTAEEKEKAEKEQEAQKSSEGEALHKRTMKGGLEIEVLKEGKGMVAFKGARVRVAYVGRLQNARGNKFDASAPKHPLTFKLGAGEVIPGWDRGVAGMRVGEKRALTVPPKLAYGEKGAPPVIPKNATLYFTVELVSMT